MAEEAHVCKQEAKLGGIEATLKARGDTDARIEANLKDLVQVVQKNRDDAQEEFRQFTASFSNIEALLKEQKTKTEESCSIQKDIKSGLTNLTTRVTNIESEVKNNKQEIANLSENAKNTEKRLSKIEGWALRIVAIITALGIVIEFFTNLDSIKKFLFPELGSQPKTEQVSNK